MKKKKPTGERVARARVQLRDAIEWACVARGGSQWTSGYISGLRAGGEQDVDGLVLQARKQLAGCARAERTAERAMRAYAAAIRQAKKGKS